MYLMYCRVRCVMYTYAPCRCVCVCAGRRGQARRGCVQTAVLWAQGSSYGGGASRAYQPAADYHASAPAAQPPGVHAHPHHAPKHFNANEFNKEWPAAQIHTNIYLHTRTQIHRYIYIYTQNNTLSANLNACIQHTGD